jgi:hypothetical protein
MTEAVWWDLGLHHGVLEIDHGLELHVVTRRDGCVAWWLDEWGRWLRQAHVGTA